MVLIQAIIASSIQNVFTSKIEDGALGDYSSVTYQLCSFSAPDTEIPGGWGYFSLSGEDFAAAVYQLCSFSAPDTEIPGGWGYFSLSGEDFATATYQLCSFSFPVNELPSDRGYYTLSGEDFASAVYQLCSFSVPENASQILSDRGYYTLSGEDFASAVYQLSSFSIPDTQLTSMYPLSISNIDTFRTSIYGVSSNAMQVLGMPAYGVFTFSYWEVSSGGPWLIVPAYQNKVGYGYLSGGESWYDASQATLSARLVFGYEKQAYRTNPVALKPYSSVLDIPNLQLWLDASDTNTTQTSSWLDKSPNSLTATQLTVVNRPSLSTINGLSALSFNGTNQFLTLSTPVQTSRPYTSFFVYKRALNTILSISLGNSFSDNESPFLHGDTSANFVYSGNSRTTNTQPFTGVIVGAVRKDEFLSLNSQQITPFNTSWGGTKTGTVNSVGRYGSSFYHNGLFGEYIQTSSALPNAEIALVSNSLKTKWGI